MRVLLHLLLLAGCVTWSGDTELRGPKWEPKQYKVPPPDLKQPASADPLCLAGAGRPQSWELADARATACRSLNDSDAEAKSKYERDRALLLLLEEARARNAKK